MPNNERNKHKPNNGEIDLIDFFKILINGKWIIAFLSASMFIISFFYSLSLPNIYQTSAILNPKQPDDMLSGSLKSFSGLANIAGINLPSNGGDNIASKAIKKAGSLSFFEKNIMPNIYLPELMAVKYWDEETSSLIFDDSIYNEKTKTWIRHFSFPQKQIPSSQESFRVFKEDHFNINEDKSNGFVTLSVRHQSPHVAKKWNELIINQINIFYRQQEKESALKSVNYLNKQINIASLSETKQALAQLLQNEIQKLTLIESHEEYVFEIIDPPVIMEEKSDPQRTLIYILSTFFGLIIGITIVFTRHYYLNAKDNV